MESITYLCAYCNSENHTFIDPSAGQHQQYVEDCQVCCSPNILTVSFDSYANEWGIGAEPEY